MEAKDLKTVDNPSVLCRIGYKDGYCVHTLEELKSIQGVYIGIINQEDSLEGLNDLKHAIVSVSISGQNYGYCFVKEYLDIEENKRPKDARESVYRDRRHNVNFKRKCVLVDGKKTIIETPIETPLNNVSK